MNQTINVLFFFSAKRMKNTITTTLATLAISSEKGQQFAFKKKRGNKIKIFKNAGEKKFFHLS